MPAYYFWGEDDFALFRAVKALQEKVLDPNWKQFNYHKLSGDNSDNFIEAFNLVMTPVFGMGGRLVWLENTNIAQSCSDTAISELQKTLSSIPDNSYLLFTSVNKPDSRLKATKLLKDRAVIQEFALIPHWQTEEISNKVREVAQKFQLSLTKEAIELLVESIGNNSRQLERELEKLSLLAIQTQNKIDKDAVASLVLCNTQNSLQLASAIRDGDRSKALSLVTGLLNANEPPLKIVATLIGQFRTWTLLKLMLESGEKDEKTIANTAEIGNPKRIYFLKKEIANISGDRLLQSLSLLLELEYSLKRGGDPIASLQTKTIELCCIFDLTFKSART
jgi:DNA polymerase-3 subunit delta